MERGNIPKTLILGMDMDENLCVGSPGISALPGDSVRELLSKGRAGLSPLRALPHFCGTRTGKKILIKEGMGKLQIPWFTIAPSQAGEVH